MSEELNPTPGIPAEDTSETTPEGAIDRFVYHQRRALEEASKAIDALLPEGFKTHGARAQEEFNKGFKVLVDAAIGELEKFSRRATEAAETAATEEQQRPSSTGKTKVKVEVE